MSFIQIGTNRQHGQRHDRKPKERRDPYTQQARVALAQRCSEASNGSGHSDDLMSMVRMCGCGSKFELRIQHKAVSNARLGHDQSGLICIGLELPAQVGNVHAEIQLSVTVRIAPDCAK